MRRWLPFYSSEATAIIKTYPQRVVFELPRIDVKVTSMRVVKYEDTWYVIGTRCLEGKVGSALAKDKHGVIDIRHVESPNSGANDTACDDTGCRCP
jgi:hypothetical protein